MDIRKKIIRRRQALRVRIENYEATRKSVAHMDFTVVNRVQHDIDRAKAELAMLEARWKL